MSADIDIDFANRTDILQHIKHTSARKLHQGKPERHNSGVYVQPIPYDPMLDASAIHYKVADERGYFKIDFLNVSVYQHIRDAAHYEELLAREPPWHRLNDPKFTEQIIHIANYSTQLQYTMPDTIPRMAMFLSILRPGKKHLQGLSWKEIAKTVWLKDDNEVYSFKHAHAVAYAVLVGLHMNLVDEHEKSICPPSDGQV